MDNNEMQVDWEKLQKMFKRITVIVYAAGLMLEIVMSVILYYTDMIEGPLPEYLKNYLIKPTVYNTIIIVAGVLVIRLANSNIVKQCAHIFMVTLMLGNIISVHNVFLIIYTVLCVPIFMSVVYRDKRLLNWVTVLCEIMLGLVILKCCQKHGVAFNNAYFWPSAAFAVIFLIVCRLIAKIILQLLEAQQKALVKANKEAEEARAQAEAASASKSNFLSNMSHEIRTPINAVLGLDEMIIRESTEDNIKDYALDIRSSSRTLLGLVNDVLDFSKIESGKLDLVVVEYDVSSMVNDLVNMISNRAYEKGLSFKVEVNPEIPHLLIGDEIRIKQIIMNLLTNAVKYTEKGNVILKLEYRKMDEENIVFLCTVTDTGKGIKEEDLEKLFAPFERIEERRNRNIEGTGLGMSITKQLLALMDSELKVESVYGEGSKFYFEIVQKVKSWKKIGNYEESYKKIKAKEKVYKEQFTAPEARILVVDDTPINLMIIKNLLKQTKVQVDTASSGAECLRLVEKNTYHVIFLDHMMPDMDGVETFNALKALQDNASKDAPVIALTANAVSGSREYYMGEGFSEYLVKPIDPMKLENMLASFLPEELVNWTE